ncbi:ATP transmembrane transporter [Aureococcus anophagefferens]|nr:ATP transmembrane transporter [Aureococcus anophagefferens]
MIRIFPQNGLMFFAKPAIGKKMKAFALRDGGLLKAQYSTRTARSRRPSSASPSAPSRAPSARPWASAESARRKMQAQGTGGRPVLYSSIWGCIAGTVKTGGIGALYTGCAANVVKMAPAQAITFGCMTVIVPALTDALV